MCLYLFVCAWKRARLEEHQIIYSPEVTVFRGAEARLYVPATGAYVFECECACECVNVCVCVIIVSPRLSAIGSV